MRKVVPQYYTDIICPKCRKPFVFIDVNKGQVKKNVPITQKQPYCRNCGFIVPDAQNAAFAARPEPLL